MGNHELIEGLNRDLAQELGTICRYIQQAAADWSLSLKARLEKIITDETDREAGSLQLLGKEGALGSEVPAVHGSTV